ncbi:MAG TPA: VOC family protein [Oleiagrimonas sp.]|nr:VOC family protein [Oleiagrimonas sp.]
MSQAANTTCTTIPCLRYRDAFGAIDWLCKAFGFEKHAVHDDGDGGVAHAQLTFGNGMVMLGSARDNAYGRHMTMPRDTDGLNTQSTYVVVADCKAHYEQARLAGADIVDAYTERDSGGAGYSCLDPEGHLWSFGSYDPWAEHV